MKKFWIPILVCLLGASAKAAEISLPNGAVLTFSVPEKLDFDVTLHENEEPWPNLWLKFSNEDGKQELAVNLFLNKSSERRLNDKELKQRLMEYYCNLYVKGSVEQKIIIYEFRGSSAVLYCTFTDAQFKSEDSQEKDKFKYLIAALSTNGAYEFTALALLNELGGNHEKAFLQVMASASISEGS